MRCSVPRKSGECRGTDKSTVTAWLFFCGTHQIGEQQISTSTSTNEYNHHEVGTHPDDAYQRPNLRRLTAITASDFVGRACSCTSITTCRARVARQLLITRQFELTPCPCSRSSSSSGCFMWLMPSSFFSSFPSEKLVVPSSTKHQASCHDMYCT